MDLPRARPRALGVGWVEGRRGEVFVAIEAGENGMIRRCHAHDPSWQNLPLIEHAVIGSFPTCRSSTELQPELFRAGLLMLRILLKIVKTGIVSESAPDPREELRTRAPEIQAVVLRLLGRALAIRQVDVGSCNGCELEIHALNNPYYNLEGLGIRFVASPRHPDMLMVTGPVAKNMEQALRIAYEATPDPKLDRGNYQEPHKEG